MLYASSSPHMIGFFCKGNPYLFSQSEQIGLFNQLSNIWFFDILTTADFNNCLICF